MYAYTYHTYTERKRERNRFYISKMVYQLLTGDAWEVLEQGYLGGNERRKSMKNDLIHLISKHIILK